MDKNIYNKLTESAQIALEETRQEITDMILEKAIRNATLKNTADKEISLRDIIEAKEEVLYQKIDANKQDSKRKRYALLLSMTGAIYAVFGIVFYLFQNKEFDTTKDLGLIIAALGILFSIVAFYYTQLISRRKVELMKDNIIIERNNSEFEIVRRWQVIEHLGTELMLKDGISDNRAKSFNFILTYLADKLLDQSKINALKKILMTRNQVVHNGVSLSKVEIDEILKAADEIIDELERKTKKH
ncbi:MAG: hypothetical protein IPO48_00130 [Saprospiraceae bacterium]|nr:hypothetical protein [Saprospiraceae bacterium]